MDIHKAKPWHGAREFLKEYVIIVIGVLTALGAEAVVENMHWRHLADQHEAELHRSAETIAAYAVQQIEVRGCLHNGLVRVAEALRKPSAGWKGLNPGASGGPAQYLPRDMTPPGHPWPQAAWDSALGDGTLSHIPAARFRVYASLYRTSHDINAQQDPLSGSLQELTPLAFDQTLSPEDKARYLTALAKVDRLENLMSVMSRSMLTSAAQDGFWPPQEAVKFLTDASQLAFGSACMIEVKRTDFLPGGAMAARPMPGAR